MLLKATKTAARPKRKVWSADDIVKVFVALVRNEWRPKHIGRGNAIRLLIKRPLAKGIINGEMVTDVEMTELKAWLFDTLFLVYGDRLAPGLRLMSEQKRRGQKGAIKRKGKGAELAAAVIKRAGEIRRTGRVTERNLAGVIATKMILSPSHVRRILKKARQTQG